MMARITDQRGEPTDEYLGELDAWWERVKNSVPSAEQIEAKSPRFQRVAMRYTHILAEYLRIVQEINGATSHDQHRAANSQLLGLKRCLRAMGWNESDIGNLIMDGDRHYIAQGIDRPMCGGVWLDWEPAAEMAVAK